LTVLVSGSTARAEPILIATFGGVSAVGSDDSSVGFTFYGRTFSIGGLHIIWEPVATCAPCVPGTSLNLSSTVTMVPGPLGFAHIDGVVSTQPVDFVGTFTFLAGSIVVPTLSPDSTGSASTGFTFTGRLAGYEDADAQDTLLFDTTISGSGTARLQFFNVDDRIGMGQIFYEIQDPAATPEPASLFLLGTGGALLAACRRRTRGGHELKE
jgi:hypothetical protein